MYYQFNCHLLSWKKSSTSWHRRQERSQPLNFEWQGDFCDIPVKMNEILTNECPQIQNSRKNCSGTKQHNTNLDHMKLGNHDYGKITATLKIQGKLRTLINFHFSRYRMQHLFSLHSYWSIFTSIRVILFPIFWFRCCLLVKFSVMLTYIYLENPHSH